MISDRKPTDYACWQSEKFSCDKYGPERKSVLMNIQRICSRKKLSERTILQEAA